MYSSIIIGGGPAGSIAGLLLARAGHLVSIIEQHRFPREKVCGECLSPLALQVLERCGLLSTITDAGAAPLDRLAIFSDRRSVKIDLEQPMLGISRGRLDEIVLNAVRDAGATVHQPARCENIRQQDDGVALRVRDLSSNQTTELTTPLVLLADGKAAFIESRPEPTGDFGIKAHFENVGGDRRAIELFASCGTYGGVAPIEANRWNVAFSVKAKALADCDGDIGAVFARLCEGNQFLASRFAQSVRCGPWLASPLPRFAVNRNWPARIVPIGNAAAALEPIGGEGIGLAMRSAELAAEFVLSGARDTTRLQKQFANLWKIRRAACRSAAVAISSPIFGGAAVRLMASSQSLAKLALRLTGKTAYCSSSCSQSSVSAGG